MFTKGRAEKAEEAIGNEEGKKPAKEEEKGKRNMIGRGGGGVGGREGVKEMWEL